MCDRLSLRSVCAYAQSDQSLCQSFEYFTTDKLQTEHHLEFLSLKLGCTGSSESTLVKCHFVGNHVSRLKCVLVSLPQSTIGWSSCPYILHTCAGPLTAMQLTSEHNTSNIIYLAYFVKKPSLYMPMSWQMVWT